MLLDEAQVRELFPITMSRSTLYRLRATDKKFPKPVRVLRRVRWHKRDIEAYLKASGLVHAK